MASIEEILALLPDAAVLHQQDSILFANALAKPLIQHPILLRQLASRAADASGLWVDERCEPWSLSTSQIDAERQLTLIRPAMSVSFQAIFMNSPQAIVIHDWFKPLFANPAYAKLVHLESVAEVLELPSIRPFFASHHLPQAKRNYQEVLDRGYLEVPPVEDFWSASGEHSRTTILDFAINWNGKRVLCTINSQSTVAEEQREQFRRMAMSDPLTGLANRRCFDAELTGRVEALQSNFAHVCLILIDLDYFKVINDTYGHPAGDRVLQCLAEQLRELPLRDALVCRIGGEEFAIICGFDDNGSLPATAIKQRLDSCDWPLRTDDSHRITVSIGVAHWRSDDDATSLYQRADDALYSAKQSGRNQICTDKHPQ